MNKSLSLSPSLSLPLFFSLSPSSLSLSLSLLLSLSLSLSLSLKGPHSSPSDHLELSLEFCQADVIFTQSLVYSAVPRHRVGKLSRLDTIQQSMVQELILGLNRTVDSVKQTIKQCMVEEEL